MTETHEYAFVLDNNCKQLYPTKVVKAWYLIRKKRATLVSKYPMVIYTFKNGETHRGYVTALYPNLCALNFQSSTKHCKKVNAKKCKLLWKYSKIYWSDNVS